MDSVEIESYLGPQALLDLLEPYLRTRQEALKIRRILGTHLISQIECPERDEAVLPPLIAASHAVGVKTAPTAVTGLRRDYLQTLQANIAARRQYESMAERISATPEINSSPNISRDVSKSSMNGPHLSTYLELLKERERLEKLQIHHHYLDKLMSKEAAQPRFLAPGNLDVNMELSSEGSMGNSTPAGGNDLDTLTEKLERTVLRAQTQLAKEKKLLSDVKLHIDSEDRGSGSKRQSANRVLALQRTKYELIEWIELQLAKSAGNEEEEQFQELSDSTFNSQEPRKLKFERIKDRYTHYVQARKLLLIAASKASAQSPSHEKVSMNSEHSHTSVSAAMDLSPALPTSIGHLVQLNDLQMSLSTLKSNHGDALAEEKAAMVQLLNRLNDESHLIPAHPRPNQVNPRPGNVLEPNFVGDEKDLEISRHTSAWVYASTVARQSTNRHIVKKADETELALKETQEGIAKLRQILGTARENKDAQDGEEEDIWVAEARGKRQMEDRRMKGPFTGLRGNV